MQSIVVHRAGGYEQLRLEEHPDPIPGKDEVLVDCEASGVNYADCVVRMGLYKSAKDFVGWPITPGFEFAGRVRELGEGVTDLAIGQAVFGVTFFGGYATRIAVPRDQVFLRPPDLDPQPAAAFPAVSLTAWYALHVLACPRPGSHVLVHSAAGGVGGTLVQLAHAADSVVVAVVGAPHKVEAARRLGADHVIDKSSEDLWSTSARLAPEGYAAVFDANGVTTLRKSYGSLAPEGRLITYGFHSMFPRGRGRPNYLKLAWDWARTPRFDPIDLTNRNRAVLGFNLSYLFDRKGFLHETMQELLKLLAEGRLLQPEITPYPLAEAARAHRELESAQTIGKLVLVSPRASDATAVETS
jgi:NADPH:quinone reductase-like Zn-dependent oxidoreductase